MLISSIRLLSNYAGLYLPASISEHHLRDHKAAFAANRVHCLHSSGQTSFLTVRMQVGIQTCHNQG